MALGYEYTNGSAKRFYYAGGTRIAVRPATNTGSRPIANHFKWTDCSAKKRHFADPIRVQYGRRQRHC